MATKVSVNLDSTEKILLKRKLNDNGEAQRFFTSEVRKHSDPYTPFDNGGLKDKQCIVTANEIQYNSPYARYLWYGKVMAGNPREPTNKDIKFHGAPRRGKMWVLRAWGDRKKDITESVAKFVGGEVK